MGDYGRVTYLLTRQGTDCRLPVANLQPGALEIRVPGMTVRGAEVFQGQTPLVEPADTQEQPYGITRRSGDGTVPGYSLTLLRLLPAPAGG